MVRVNGDPRRKGCSRGQAEAANLPLNDGSIVKSRIWWEFRASTHARVLSEELANAEMLSSSSEYPFF
jgi:hypothetical protein